MCIRLEVLNNIIYDPLRKRLRNEQTLLNVVKRERASTLNLAS